ncbi:MAG: site-specific integrase [Acidobacteria bacterium]|nr:site-specific integrase [Acidobacteriota bacterium]
MLTDRDIRSLKPPLKGNVIRYDSGGVPGFGCRVTAAGVRSFVLSYRARGIARRLTIGRYGIWSVAAARKRAAELKRAVDIGEDPLQAKREAAERGMRFGELVELYLTRHAVQFKDHGKIARQRIEGNLRPWYGRSAADITRADVRRLMESKAVDAPRMANRLREVVSQVFAFGISRELITGNPATGIKRIVKETPCERVLTREEIGHFWTALDAAAVQPAMRSALRLALVSGQRIGEICSIERAELSDGGTLWTIPPHKAKNGKAHRVPLSRLAREILDAQPRIDEGPIFRGARGGRAIQPEKVSKALFANLAALGMAHFTCHDLRRTCATGMASIGVDSVVISAILGHSPRGVTERVYQKYSRDAEKRQALERWARHLLQIVSVEFSKVVSIHD